MPLTFPYWQHHCLQYPQSEERQPFGPEPYVYYVAGKMFALLSPSSTPFTMSLKCEPFHAQALRAHFPAIAPGYHLNKQHWNTVTLDGSLSLELVMDMVRESYLLVVAGLKKAEREAILQELQPLTPAKNP